MQCFRGLLPNNFKQRAQNVSTNGGQNVTQRRRATLDRIGPHWDNVEDWITIAILRGLRQNFHCIGNVVFVWGFSRDPGEANLVG